MQATTQRKTYGRLPKLKSYKMELQISRRIYPQVSPPAVVWGGEAGIGRGVSPIGPAKGVRDRGGAFAARSGAPAAADPAEAGGLERGGVFERQERDPRGPAFFEAGKELCRAAALGAGLLRGHGGAQ